MKRDLSLIRTLLLTIEGAPAGAQYTASYFAPIVDRDSPTVVSHIDLMIQADLVEGVDVSENGRPPEFLVRGLTKAGHEAVALLRPAGAWAAVQEAQDAFDGLPWEIVLDVAGKWMAEPS